MFKAKIYITLRESILDPKGKASHKALENLGYTSVKKVRIGKMIEMDIEAESASQAEEIAEESCKKLLANEVMENYSIEILK